MGWLETAKELGQLGATGLLAVMVVVQAIVVVYLYRDNTTLRKELVEAYRTSAQTMLDFLVTAKDKGLIGKTKNPPESQG